MSQAVRAIRGATTLERDEAVHLTERVQEMMHELLGSNDLEPADLISVLVTATSDVCSRYPAAAIRELGLDDVALMGAQELNVTGGLALCIRVMVHAETDRSKAQLKHVFLHQARKLRSDLVD